MKKSVLVLMSCLCFATALVFAGCSSESSSGSDPYGSEPGNETGQKDESGSGADTGGGNTTGKTEDGTTVTTKEVSSSVNWIFSDLASVSCEAVDATTAIESASALASATTYATTFGGTDSKKFSLKSDVEYPSSDGSDGSLVAVVKSLDEDGVPIQYCKYESSASCKVTDATKGALQIVKDAFVISDVQGPFDVLMIYSGNSKTAKTDGRYGYVKINGTEYADETVKNAKSLNSDGVSITHSYTGTDKVSVTVGATNWVRLFDVRIITKQTQTVEVTVSTDDDGVKTTTTVIKDSDGNVISTDTTYSSSTDTSGGSGTSDTPSTDSQGDKSNVSTATSPVLDNSSLAPSYTSGRKVGMRSNIKDVNTSTLTNVLYASPDGSSSANGTKSSPLDLQSAINKITEGGAVVLIGGTYKLSSTITIAETNNGTESARKYLLPESGSSAILDFTEQATADSARGIQLNGSYWHIYGITCYNAGDNGMLVTGKNNIVERCVFQANQDTGLQIARRKSSLSDMADWPSGNLILNCTSFDNKDDKTGENADGFASKLTCGEDNVFDGCISYANCDDGWDLYAKPATGSIGVVTIRNCVSFQNGKTTTGAAYANGDMNGFKLGGSNGKCPTPHVVTNCLAFLNGKDGFTDNGNGGALQVSSCTSYANVNSNFNFYRTFAGGVFKELVSMLGGNNATQVDKFGGKESECTAASKISDSVFCADKKKKTFYYVTAETEIYNGSKFDDTVSDLYSSEIVSASAPEIGLDVDGKCRNRDGTINLGGYLETKDSSAYSVLGAHFGDEAETVLDCGL